MERVIKLSDLRDAINEAYEEFKNCNEGIVDARVKDANTDDFAISVALTDGTVINKGNTNDVFPMGQISRVPVTSLRVEQHAARKAAAKAAGQAKCACGCKADKPHVDKPDVHGARGIKAISKLEPKGDSDSKWNFIENRLTALIGSAPKLDDKLYRELIDQAKADNVVGKLVDAKYPLADNPAESVDIYLRGLAMTVNTQQLAEMGATIAADGVNPFTRQIVYDGVLSQKLVARLAMKSHKLRRFIMKTGLPASAGFGGGIVGVLPGVFSIAAYSPRLNERGVSTRAAKAIKYIMKKLNLSVFSSAKVTVEK